MPLVEACSLQTYDQNLRSELQAGRPPEQAAAIARDVLERACERIGKPVPQRSNKACGKKPVSKKKTREYLEAALEHAKKMLPGWMFAVIHQAAMPSSGGRAKANRRLEVMEKAWVEKADSCKGMTNPELKAALYKLNKALAMRKRQGLDTESVLMRGGEIVAEMKARKLPTKGAIVDEAMKFCGKPHTGKAAKACGLPHKTKKDFFCGSSDGGAHAHALNRASGKTYSDGEHMHIFVLPGEDETVATMEDGAHEHELEAPNVKRGSGKHSHRVYLPSGRELETGLGGEHGHGIMYATTTLDGGHQHVLKMPDGTTLTSLTVPELLVQFDGEGMNAPGPLPPAHALLSSWNRLFQAEQELTEMRMMALPEVVEEAMAGEMVEPPPEILEVREIDGNMLTATTMEGDAYTLKRTVAAEVGDIVEVRKGHAVSFADSVTPDDNETIAFKRIYAEEMRKAVTAIPFQGAEKPRVVYVGSEPNGIELARRSALVGPDGETFDRLYLAPLGLTRKDVAVGFVRPIDPTAYSSDAWDRWLEASLGRYNGTMVVALGRVAKMALGDRAAFTLPHPAAVRRFGHSGEVTRKVRAMAKALDISPSAVDGKAVATRPVGQPSEGGLGATLAETISELRSSGAIKCRVVKAAPEKHIVYGVVLDPYSVDLQNEWVPPATIEDTAHDFVERSRVIGLQHVGKADATLVESWVELYPSEGDRAAALDNQPHRVFKRKFGDDEIHSGSWVAGVRLSDSLWDAYQRGDFGAFSVGGFSFKTNVSTNAMPEVEIIDLAPSA